MKDERNETAQLPLGAILTQMTPEVEADVLETVYGIWSSKPEKNRLNKLKKLKLQFLAAGGTCKAIF